MSDRWSDLCLWPARAEVSPLREEPPATVPSQRCKCHPADAYLGCTRCPSCGHWSFDEMAGACERRTCGHAVARSTDPGTSWEAARSITPEKLRESQQVVLMALRGLGPMTDERLCWHLAEYLSPSGARSRRSELVAMGLVRDSGRKDVLRSGRRAIVWEAV